ncbi:MAG: ABC transporter permease [Ectothiorhodospiraceae bacterium]|nr:ABC transporter permease [Ectothiorhodospiraceae bacterium]MCH8504651.1 ABC transporter permease [Ectothiorhodospiraceae bacterium]
MKALNALSGYLRPVWGVLALLAVWWVIWAAEVANPLLLPSPQATMLSLWNGMVSGDLWGDFLSTVKRTMAGFALAAAVAIPLGIFLGSTERLYRSLEFVIDFFRSTPASALFPLFLILFGVGEAAKILVAAFGASLVILFNVAYGVMNARQTRLLAAQIMGANKLQKLRDVMFWESLPQTFVGLRNGISLTLVIIIVAEMFIGSSDGLGHRLVQAQMLFRMPEMYAAIFAAGALGYGLNWASLQVEKRVVHWGGK